MLINYRAFLPSAASALSTACQENVLPEIWTIILKRQKTTGLKGSQISPSIIKNKLNLTTSDNVEYASGQTFLQSIDIESHELCTDYDECVRRTRMANAMPIVIGEDITEFGIRYIFPGPR